ncbi:MAG: hypothetical protein AAFR28_07365 [Pseudomonadota bacterium]
MADAPQIEDQPDKAEGMDGAEQDGVGPDLWQPALIGVMLALTLAVLWLG